MHVSDDAAMQKRYGAVHHLYVLGYHEGNARAVRMNHAAL